VRGRKVLGGARQAHECLYGTKEEKETRWAQYLNECINVAKKFPNWNLKAIRATVAKTNNVADKTIERHTPTLASEVKKLRK